MKSATETNQQTRRQLISEWQNAQQVSCCLTAHLVLHIEEHLTEWATVGHFSSTCWQDPLFWHALNQCKNSFEMEQDWGTNSNCDHMIWKWCIRCGQDHLFCVLINFLWWFTLVDNCNMWLLFVITLNAIKSVSKSTFLQQQCLQNSSMMPAMRHQHKAQTVWFSSAITHSCQWHLRVTKCCPLIMVQVHCVMWTMSQFWNCHVTSS